MCGGSIISDKHILTSGRCASGDFTIYVHLGDTILGNDKDVNYNKTVLVTNITLHPDYVDEPSNVLLNKTFRASIGIHAKSQTLFLFGTLLIEFSIHKKFQNKLILSILIA